MNPSPDEFDSIERQLHRLRPTEVSPEMMDRLVRSRRRAYIEPAAGEAGAWTILLSLWRRVWIPLTVCAVAGVGVLAIQSLFLLPEDQPMERPTIAKASSRQEFAPAQMENYLVGAREVAIVQGEDQRTYRLVRCTWIDREVYRAKEGDSQLYVLQAREQVVPVALEFY